jgi:hypothetical protein
MVQWEHFGAVEINNGFFGAVENYGPMGTLEKPLRNRNQ